MCTSSVFPEVYRYMNRGLFERDKMMFKHRAWKYDVFPELCSHMVGVPSEAHGCSEDFCGQWWPALSWADFPCHPCLASDVVSPAAFCIIGTFPTSPNCHLNCGIMKWIWLNMWAYDSIICELWMRISTFSKPICKRLQSKDQWGCDDFLEGHLDLNLFSRDIFHAGDWRLWFCILSIPSGRRVVLWTKMWKGVALSANGWAKRLGSRKGWDWTGISYIFIPLSFIFISSWLPNSIHHHSSRGTLDLRRCQKKNRCKKNVAGNTARSGWMQSNWHDTALVTWMPLTRHLSCQLHSSKS